MIALVIVLLAGVCLLGWRAVTNANRADLNESWLLHAEQEVLHWRGRHKILENELLLMGWQNWMEARQKGDIENPYTDLPY